MCIRDRLAWSPRFEPIALNTKLFPQKNNVLLSNFFSSLNMFFIRLFLANTWEKDRRSPSLFLHKLLWKVDMALRSQSGWIILRGGDWSEMQNKPHRVRSMQSRSSSFSVVFKCLISATQKFKLEKSTLNTKEWGKSRFDEILEVWIFILDYFVVPAFCVIPVR